jgi:PIN domain nuclease of toxin-antitoxin system
LALLDAYAVIALVADEPASGEVENIVHMEQSYIVLTNLAEVIFITRRTHGLALDEVRAALEPMLLTRVLQTVSSSESETWQAAELRAQHYDRKTRAVSLADCFLLAHALAGNHDIATSDQPLAAAARAEGVTVLSLPNSAGDRP